MKTSLITTVFNEQKTITSFLESIFKQTRLPDEIIIVDGGSTDDTISAISNFQFLISEKNGPNIKLIFKKGNRSMGRNEAIKNASGDIILISDAGCILDKNWVKNITTPFLNKDIDVVAGYYKGIAKTIFQKCLIPYVLVMEDKVNGQDFLPATRSMALKKSVWKKVVKFDEKLSHNEDYAFANKLKIHNAKIVFRKDAIANWIPRGNLKQAFIMFFRFALGDSEAKIFRDKVVYIFLRYTFAAYLIVLSLIMRSYLLWLFVVLFISAYIIWSIAKNYKYVEDINAFIFLPVLQITSDLAVITGTLVGLIKNISLRKIIELVSDNKGVTLLVFIYASMMLSVIGWGIPGLSHPFTYHMDEWHQSQSVRDLFKYGTPNIAGAANGSIFQFFLTGIYLIPFYLLHIVNVFAIKSSVTNLSIQTILFEVLRFNTLIFGVLSAVVVAYIAKKYFRINPFLTVFLFIFNPLWITLSNYFKYDIALMFWILLTFLFMLKYVKQNKFIDFLLAGIFSSLSLSTKLEPFNLLFVYVAIFFLFTSKFYTKIKYLFWGLFAYLIVFLFFGIPDIILGKGSLVTYLTSNLQAAPNAAEHSLSLGMSYWLYFLSILYPVSFGRVFYFAFIISLIFGIFLLLRRIILRKPSFIGIINRNRYPAVLFLVVFSYALSLLPMRTGALSNRLVPLIPFMAIVVVCFATYLYKKIDNKIGKGILIILICLFFLIQFIESYAWFSLKVENNSRAVASKWIIKNIKQGTIIGLENIPIYQLMPDVILKEFYLKQYGRGQANMFNYVIVSSQTKTFPKVVILTNDYVESKYLITSEKKLIVEHLRKQDYRQIKTFTIQSPLFSFFNDRLEYYMASIMPLPDTISIYEKQ